VWDWKRSLSCRFTFKMNTQVYNEIRDALKLNLNVERMPNAIPVIEVNPKIVKNGFLENLKKGTSGGGTVFTSNSNKLTYITQIVFTMVKDATCDVADGTLGVSFNIDNKAYYIDIPILTLTAQNQTITINFEHPVLMDKGSNFVFSSNTFTVGKMWRSVAITGFLDEYSNA